MDAWSFFTSGTAPWWSGLLGTLIGGLITYLTTNYITEKQRIAAISHAEDDRIHAAKNQWRSETIALVSELLVAFYRYQDVTLKIRRDLSVLFPNEIVQGTDEHKAYRAKADELGDDVLDALSEVRRVTSMLQITSAGDIAVASVILMSTIAEYDHELANYDFQVRRLDLASASANLIKIAADELGHPFGADSDLLGRR
ncbi:hypothetical protein [Paeniglutamicibacter sp. NPDC091659]|uniref:hypothetical protein n=1 Tax=Paeniglutamicibacter sp. NPDC091659 TaxID=3364389 RepID=UPI003810F6EE